MNKWIFFVAGIVVGVILTGFFNLLKLSSESTEGNGSKNTEMKSKKDMALHFLKSLEMLLRADHLKSFKLYLRMLL